MLCVVTIPFLIINKDLVMSHTPGPWINRKPYLYKVVAGKTENHSSVMFAIADLESFTTMQHISHEERQANARLIASAPELLDRVKEVLAWMESVNDGEEDIVLQIKKCKEMVVKSTEG